MPILTAEEKALKEERGVNHTAMKKIYADADGAALDSDKQAEFDKRFKREEEIAKELNEIEAKQKKHEENGQRLGALGEVLDVRSFSINPDDAARQIVNNHEREQKFALWSWMAGGGEQLSPQARASLRYGQWPGDTPRRGGDVINIGNGMIPADELTWRAQSVGTDTAGGFTVPEITSPTIESAVKDFSGVRQSNATILPTPTGGDLVMPTSTDTAQTGELLAENTTAALQDITIGAVTLQSFMYTSKTVLVSLQLLQDSPSFGQEFVFRNLGERIGRIQNTHFTTGDASSKPNGIVTASTLGKTGASPGTAIIFDELIDLKHAVDPAYRVNSPQFMFHDLILAAIKKLSIGSSDARPLWQPSLIVGEPSTIDGDSFVTNADMQSTIAAAKKIALYGDMRKYIVRDAGGITLLRQDELYSADLQVGFLAFRRSDADLVDGTGGAIKHLITAAS